MIVFISVLISLLLATTKNTEAYKAYKAAIPFIDHVTKSTLPNHGQALIFYGAEWCVHCQKFTPIWLEFQRKVKENKWDSLLTVAKIECTQDENVEFCSKLDGYPTVKRYSEGVEKGEFNDRTLNSLLEEAAKIIQEFKGESDRLLKLLEEEKNTSTNNPDGKVVELTDAIFDSAVRGKPFFIKFYAPWCGHCKSLAPIWEELALTTIGQVNIGSVDCTIHKNACQKYQIAGYPTLIYINDESKTQFSGSRNLHTLKKFVVEIINKPSFQVIPVDEIKPAIKSNPSVLFYVYNGQSEKDIKTFGIVYDSLKAVKGKIKVLVCPHKEAYKALGLEMVPDAPTLLIYRDGGIDYDLYSGDFDDTRANREKIQSWILSNRHPLVPELDEATQKELTKTSSLLVLAIIDPENKSDHAKLKSLVDISQNWKNAYPTKRVKFAWLHGLKYASYVKKVYSLSPPDFPRFYITKPSEDSYYDSHQSGKAYEFTKSSVFLGLEEVLEEKPKSSKGMLGLFVLQINRTTKWIWAAITYSWLTAGLAMMIFIIGLYQIMKFALAPVEYKPVADHKDD